MYMCMYIRIFTVCMYVSMYMRMYLHVMCTYTVYVQVQAFDSLMDSFAVF